jgi:hypothetical protein
MRLNPWQLIVPVALAAVLIAAVALHSAASESCGDADDAAANYLLEAAQTSYEDVLSEEPGSECARVGMADVISKLCNRAERLALGKADDQAKKIYASVLTIEPDGSTATCALTGLAAFDKPDEKKKRPCECGEVDDPDPADPEAQEPERQEPERQEPERQEPERQEPERQEPERQEWTG